MLGIIKVRSDFFLKLKDKKYTLPKKPEEEEVIEELNTIVNEINDATQNGITKKILFNEKLCNEYLKKLDEKFKTIEIDLKANNKKTPQDLKFFKKYKKFIKAHDPIVQHKRIEKQYYRYKVLYNVMGICTSIGLITIFAAITTGVTFLAFCAWISTMASQLFKAGSFFYKAKNTKSEYLELVKTQREKTSSNDSELQLEALLNQIDSLQPKKGKRENENQKILTSQYNEKSEKSNKSVSTDSPLSNLKPPNKQTSSGNPLPYPSSGNTPPL